MRSEAAESSRETVRIKGGQSKEVGSRESQSEGVEERREASAREGCKGGVLVERRFCRTTSRWPRAMNSDWGGFRRSSLVVRPRIVMYPRRIALSRVGRRAEGAGDVRGEGSVFKVKDRGSTSSGVD